MSRRGQAWGLLAGAVSARSTLTLLASHPPGGTARWARSNHAGRPVTLLEGPAYVVGLVGGVLSGGVVGGGVAGGLLPARAVSTVAAAGVAALGAGAFGLLDDLAGDRTSRGLRGHLGALRRGRVTTGAVKVLGLALTGLAAATLADRPQPSGLPREPVGAVPGRVPGGVPSLLSTLVGGAVVAGSANLVNLLDLRPGRALKVVLVTGTALAATGRAGSAAPGMDAAAAAAAGAALACLPGDLAGRTMLGDTGANAAGAVLGCALVQRAGLRGRLAALAVLVALTAASERVSFTAVIERTPVLRELDALGR